MRRTTITATSTVLGAGFVLAGLGLGTAGAASVEPQLVEGNPSCEQVLPGSVEHKLDFAPADGDYTDGTVTITISNSDGSSLDWASDLDLGAVIMKGGAVANVYLYPGDADLTDTNLVTPTNPNNQQPYGTSNVSFCYGVDTPGDEPGDEPEQPEEPQRPEVPEEPEVLGTTTSRRAELPRTGAPTVILAAAGVALTSVGEVLRRLGKR